MNNPNSSGSQPDVGISNKKDIKTIRLHNTVYNRPEVTITDTLQNEAAYRKKLKGYQQVDDIDFVGIRTHVRYFVYDIDEEKWKFRTGGILTKKHNKYVVLSNGRYSWSVQREVKKGDDIWETKFFKILNKQELAEIALEKQQEEISRLREENEALRSQMMALHQT
jgi:hypothetical protein